MKNTVVLSALVLLLLVILVSYVDVASSAKASSGRKKKSKADDDDDDDDDASDPHKAHRYDMEEKMHCPICLAFCASLRRSILKHQPLAVLKGVERKRFLNREDRVDEVMEDALVMTTRDYTWIEEEPGRGRFYHYDFMKKTGRDTGKISAEAWEQIEKQREINGDAQRKHYVRMSILGKFEDALEMYIRKNVTDYPRMVEMVCAGRGRRTEGVCQTEEQVKQSLPYHLEDAAGKKKKNSKIKVTKAGEDQQQQQPDDENVETISGEF
eukprot:PhM_4_TR2080/c0_g2_i1/m.72214